MTDSPATGRRWRLAVATAAAAASWRSAPRRRQHPPRGRSSRPAAPPPWPTPTSWSSRTPPSAGAGVTGSARDLAAQARRRGRPDLPARAARLRGPALGDGGPAARRRPGGRVRRAEPHRDVTGTQDNPPSWGLDRIDQRDLPLDDSYTYPNTARERARVHHRHRHPVHPQRLRRPGDHRLRRRRRRHGRRLQRPRHPRRRHRRRHRVRRGQGRHSWSASGCSTAPAAAPTPASSPASTGSPRPRRSSRRWPT